MILGPISPLSKRPDGGENQEYEVEMEMPLSPFCTYPTSVVGREVGCEGLSCLRSLPRTVSKNSTPRSILFRARVIAFPFFTPPFVTNSLAIAVVAVSFATISSPSLDWTSV